MKAFWIVFILAILFVVGSAMAMNYFGNSSANGQQKNKTKEHKED